MWSRCGFTRTEIVEKLTPSITLWNRCGFTRTKIVESWLPRSPCEAAVASHEPEKVDSWPAQSPWLHMRFHMNGFTSPVITDYWQIGCEKGCAPVCDETIHETSFFLIFCDQAMMKPTVKPLWSRCETAVKPLWNRVKPLRDWRYQLSNLKGVCEAVCETKGSVKPHVKPHAIRGVNFWHRSCVK